MSDQPTYEEWLKTRPECVRGLAREFPVGTYFEHEGVTMYVIGYNESDMLLVSPVWPGDDYDEALRQKRYVCAGHFRPSNSPSTEKPLAKE